MQNVILKNKPIILKNTDFQTIQIKVLFPFKNDVENAAYMQLLPSLLETKNNTYPTGNEYLLARKKLFILSHYAFFSTFGDTAFYIFNLSIPKKDLLENDNIEEQFKFFRDSIYNPLTENGVFSQFELDKEKDNLILGMDNALKNNKPYQSIKIKELIDEDGVMTKDVIYHRELIDKVSLEEICFLPARKYSVLLMFCSMSLLNLLPPSIARSVTPIALSVCSILLFVLSIACSVSSIPRLIWSIRPAVSRCLSDRSRLQLILLPETGSIR